jgi:hypothetical protein
MRSELTDELFDKICDDLQSSSDSLHKVLEKFDTTSFSFYKVMRNSEAKTDQYMQARSIYVENKLAERAKILDQAQVDAENNPKCANAIAQIAKERCRIIEWDCIKLIPKVYGDAVKIDVDDKLLTREIVLTAPAIKKVSNNPKSSETNNNDNVSH